MTVTTYLFCTCYSSTTDCNTIMSIDCCTRNICRSIVSTAFKLVAYSIRRNSHPPQLTCIKFYCWRNIFSLSTCRYYSSVFSYLFI